MLGFYAAAAAAVLSTTHVWLSVTPWTVAHQAPLSMGFSRQEYWSGLLFPPSGDLPDPGIKPASPALEGWFLTTAKNHLRPLYLFFCFWTVLTVNEDNKRNLMIIHNKYIIHDNLLVPRKHCIVSEVAQSCPTLSGPMDCSLPGSFVHGIFQERVLDKWWWFTC